MNNKFKIVLSCLIFTVIWICVGFLFVNYPPYSNSVNDHILSILYASLGALVFIFLPINLLIFSVSKKVRIFAFVLLIIAIVNLTGSIFLSLTVEEFVRNSGGLFSYLYLSSTLSSLYLFGFFALVNIVSLLSGKPFSM